MIPQKVIHYTRYTIQWKNKEGQVLQNPTMRQKIDHLVEMCVKDAPPNEDLHYVTELVSTFLKIGHQHPEWLLIAEGIARQIVEKQLEYHQQGLHSYFILLPTKCATLIMN